MATTIGTLAVHFSANPSGFNAGAQQVSQGLVKINADFDSTIAKMAAFVGGFAAIRAAISGLGWGVKLAAEAEKANIAFEVLTGSAAKAKKVLDEIRAFEAATPFEFTELRTASQGLLAFGVDSKNLIPTLSMLGDISAGTGSRIEELAELFGKAKVQGRLFQQDVNQLTGRGIPVIQEFAKQFGVLDTEVRELVEQGKIGFPQMEQALKSLTSAGGLYYELTAKQSQSLLGRYSTLKSSVDALATSIGDVLAPAAGMMVNEGIKLLDWLKTFDIETVKTVVEVTAFTTAFGLALVVIPKVATAVVSVYNAIKSLAAGMSVVQALSGPKGWAVLAASLAVAGGSVVAINKVFDQYDKTLAQNAEAAANSETATKELTNTFRDANGELINLTDQFYGMGDGIVYSAEAAAMALDEELNASLEDTKNQLQEVKDKYEQLRRNFSGGSIFSAASERGTVSGFAFSQNANVQGEIVRVLNNILRAEREDTNILDKRLRDVESAIKENKIKIKEARI